jgi:hypothetical protein
VQLAFYYVDGTNLSPKQLKKLPRVRAFARIQEGAMGTGTAVVKMEAKFTKDGAKLLAFILAGNAKCALL